MIKNCIKIMSFVLVANLQLEAAQLARAVQVPVAKSLQQNLNLPQVQQIIHQFKLCSNLQKSVIGVAGLVAAVGAFCSAKKLFAKAERCCLQMKSDIEYTMLHWKNKRAMCERYKQSVENNDEIVKRVKRSKKKREDTGKVYLVKNDVCCFVRNPFNQDPVCGSETDVAKGFWNNDGIETWRYSFEDKKLKLRVQFELQKQGWLFNTYNVNAFVAKKH